MKVLLPKSLVISDEVVKNLQQYDLSQEEIEEIKKMHMSSCCSGITVNTSPLVERRIDTFVGSPEKFFKKYPEGEVWR